MSTPVVAIVAAGQMGAGIARRLVENNVRVLTLLNSRSAATQKRAAEAGMTAASVEEIMEADLLLSILPPSSALGFAEQTSFALKSARRKPVFVDCNAVSPVTVRHIHAVISATGAEFVDASIIGFPPEPKGVKPSGQRPAGYDPHVYASGEFAAKFAVLGEYGLDVRVLNGPVGAASALKMAFAGISKGTIAIVTAMILAAERSGSGQALRQELSESEQPLMKSMSVRVPRMFPKAWRWVAEMQEIAEFAKEDPAAYEMWTSIAALYERLAEDVAGNRKEADVLAKFFEK
jgi:3-hydroxyisobutyrate dehydrogenase-like beta-hydroxyacid dehydrogenase